MVGRVGVSPSVWNCGRVTPNTDVNEVGFPVLLGDDPGRSTILDLKVLRVRPNLNGPN